jgi:DNA polymerase-3 subunit alpha
MSYVPVHLHTDYSNSNMKDSVNTIDNTLKRLKEIGATSWAITDHGTTSGIAEAYKKSKKQGIKLIPGYEGYLTADLSIQQRDLSHITFWAKDAVGLRNLYELSTNASGDKGNAPNNYYFKPRLDIDLIRKYSKGLMLGSACLGGWLRKPVKTLDDKGKAVVTGYTINEDLLVKFIDIFGNDDVFLEIHTYQCSEQYEYNRELVALSKKYNVRLVAATDVHFTWKHDADLRKAFKNTSKNEDGDENIDDTLYIQDVDEIRSNLSYLPIDVVDEAIANTNVIAERSNVDIEFGGKHYPHFPCDDPYEAVRQKCVDGWERIKASGVDLGTYGERIKKELLVLRLQDYCGYFLITGDYMTSAVNKGIPIGPGRGSAAASLVAMLCGITKLDPVELNLTFERFAHEERLAPPDKICRAS